MKKSTEDVAAARFAIISPLLDAALDPVLRIEKQKEVAWHCGKSYRTIGRWLKAYQSTGFAGLKPQKTCPKTVSALPENYAEVVEAAITLRRECPSRSVRDIIQILELEGVAEKGSLSRSTLQRHLQKEGFGMRQIRMYAKHDAASRRFSKTHRCMLYQGDIKYGPYLPVGKDGQKKQTYLAAWIDDATRFVVSAKFYTNQKVDIIEDTLREAILTYGEPEAIYVDNGKQYRSNWLQKACARLGIRLLHAKPYHPEGKGYGELHITKTKLKGSIAAWILFLLRLPCKSRKAWKNSIITLICGYRKSTIRIHMPDLTGFHQKLLI